MATITEADRKRAAEIYRARKPFQREMGSLEKTVTEAIAQGIAEGREQARMPND